MIDKEFIAYFKLAHGFFNLCMMALFCFQGWLGFLIRQARTSSAPVPIDTVGRHRKAGPWFALWGVMGYLAGIIVTLLDKGRVLEFPLHFLAGSLIAAMILSVYAVSRRIAGREPRFRNIHFGLGMLLLALYVVQAMLGVGILL
jgi:hypothetical protein